MKNLRFFLHIIKAKSIFIFLHLSSISKKSLIGFQKIWVWSRNSQIRETLSNYEIIDRNAFLEKNMEQGNRGDIRRIHVTRQFFETSGRHGNFFQKNKKKTFLHKVNASMCAKFQVRIVFRLARRRDTHKHINTHTHTHIYE